MAAQEARTLRAISFRISAATPKELLGIIPHVANQLSDCKTLLSNTTIGKDSQEAVALHKFKTQVKTLLSSKSSEGRWAGTILTKATIELGGHETLSQSGTWVRLLLTNLTKSDPSSAKELIVITLTRIFDLTHRYQSLVREITTPGLQTFTTACLNLIAPKATSGTFQPSTAQHELLPTVLSSFAHLLPRHPTIFRSHLVQIQHLLLSILDSQTRPSISPVTSSAARNLYTLLHFSAPKSNNVSAGDAYSKTLTSLLNTAHFTTSLVYRSVIEDWSPLPGNIIPQSVVPMDIDLLSPSADEMGLPPWRGIHNGCTRLRSLLSLFRAFMFSQTSGQVSVPLGAIVDVLLRVNSVTIPPQSLRKNTKTATSLVMDASIRPNEQISQSERDALFTELPAIHVAAMSVVSALCSCFGPLTKPLHDIFLQQIFWVFGRESSIDSLRTVCYETLSFILSASAAGMQRPTVRACIPLLEYCCEDVVPCSSPASSGSAGKDGTQPDLTADTLTAGAVSSSSPAISRDERPTSLGTSADRLLAISLLHLPSQHVPHTLRAKLDRSAILSQNKDAMLASTLNPPAAASGKAPPPSLLPFLAQADAGGMSVEGLCRPRMPGLKNVSIRGAEPMEDDFSDGDDILDEAENVMDEASHSELDDLPPKNEADASPLEFYATNTNYSNGTDDRIDPTSSYVAQSKLQQQPTSRKRSSTSPEPSRGTAETKKPKVHHPSADSAAPPHSAVPTSSHSIKGIESTSNAPSFGAHTTSIAVPAPTFRHIEPDRGIATFDDDEGDEDDSDDYEVPLPVLRGSSDESSDGYESDGRGDNDDDHGVDDDKEPKTMTEE